jgi:putative ABC transport system permease protein
MNFIQLALESFRFAWHALKANILRTTLSLLGVTVGIFAIIAVFTIVDALESSVRGSLATLGDKVIYVQKWPWSFDNGPYPWWKYYNRPSPSVAEYRFLDKYLETKKAVAIVDSRGNVTVKRNSNSMNGTNVQGVSIDYNLVSEFDIVNGRYFSIQEVEASREVAIIGDDIAKALFPDSDPIGQIIKVKGLKFQVIGVLKRQGESLLNFDNSFDQSCYIPYGTFSKLFQRFNPDPLILVKGLETDTGLEQLEGELTGLMRSRHSLKPSQESDFALNRPEAIAKAFSSIFDVLGTASWVIGGFSLLVGGFGIANIMFVSVKERTNIIGIQKSLGAKNSFILYQFLFEAIFLSLIGGGVGLLLVFLIMNAIPMGSLEVTLSLSRIIMGFSISSIIGILAGIIPAALASRLDPVIAIRSN